MVQRRGAQPDEQLARGGHRIRHLLEHEHLRPAVAVDTNRLHDGQTIRVRARDLQRHARTLGLDVVGAAPAAPYVETERHIRERRARGLFADMKFTMARPEESCHPETLLPGARTVVSAALCYYAPEPERPPGHGRLPRYTWLDAYAELREKLDELGRRLGGSYRVLVDANQHVDREAAARSGVGLLREEHDADHADARLVGRAGHARHERRDRADAAARPRLRRLQALHRRVPDRRARRAGRPRRDALPLVLDAGRRAHTRGIPRATSARRCTAATSARTSARGTAASRSGAPAHPLPDGAEPHVSLLDWLTADADDLRRRYERLFVPQNDGRWLKRNALVAAGNVGGEAERAEVERHRNGDDEMLSGHATAAAAHISQRDVHNMS